MSQAVDIVGFVKDDPGDCKNWPVRRKRRVVLLICILAFAAVFGSSFYAAAEIQINQRYGVNATTSSSGLTVYVLGFSLGPLFWPLSEMYGRRLPYRLSWPMLVATSAVSAWVDNIAVIIIYRFLSGCAAACALNNGGGIMSDVYNIVDMQGQARAIALYAAAISTGPCVALPIGFFISANAPSELWVLRVYFFFVAALLPIAWLLPETHGPTALAWRSKRLRKEGRPNARAAHELKHESKKQVFLTNIGRPAAMFIREPIIQGAAIWTSLAYGIVYFFFEAYPVVFFQNHHFEFQFTGLPFIAMVVGFWLAAIPYRYLVQLFSRIHVPQFIQPGSQSPDSPESALKLALFGCSLMPVAMFWFAWTSGEDTPWIVPTLAGALYAFSTLIIFYTFLTYSSQTYTIYASSASACNTFSRSLVGAIFPVASHTILSHLGTKWGVSVFGFLSLGLLPIPLIFLRYGEFLRKNSHYAHEAGLIVARMRPAAAQGKRDAMAATSSNVSVASQTKKSTDAIVELDDRQTSV